MTAAVRELWRAGQLWRDLTDAVRREAAGRRTVVLVSEHGTVHELDFERGRWLRAPARGGRPERQRFNNIDFVTPCGARIVESHDRWHDSARVLLAVVGRPSWRPEPAPSVWVAPGHPDRPCPGLWCPHGAGPADHAGRIVAWRQAGDE